MTTMNQIRVRLYPPTLSREIFEGETLDWSLDESQRQEAEILAHALAEQTLHVADRDLRDYLDQIGAFAFLEVHLVGKDVIRRLNASAREFDEVTDVLSFPLLQMQDGVLVEEPTVMDVEEVEGIKYLQLGELVLCHERILEQAKDYGHSVYREAAFLFVHGLLHVIGYDHDIDHLAEKQMEILQEEVLNSLGFSRDIAAIPASLQDLDEPSYLPRMSQEERAALEPQAVPEEEMRAGFVTIIGRPNIGKSTLFNQLMDYPLAITTRKAQTTRRDIRGVIHRPDAQIVLIDTPGVAKGDSRLEEAMAKTQTMALQDADLALLMVDARYTKPGKPEQRLIARLKKEEVPAILLVNKIDMVQKETLLPLIATYAELYPFKEIIPISALKNDGIDELLDLIVPQLPVHPPYYDETAFTDQSEKLLAAEYIRKQILENYHDELPYSMAVLIDSFNENYEGDERQSCDIYATILCESESQKKILQGKNFKAIKRLQRRSQASLEDLLDCSVDLDLHVKVRKNWRYRPGDLRALGLDAGSEEGLVPLQ